MGMPRALCCGRMTSHSEGAALKAAMNLRSVDTATTFESARLRSTIPRRSLISPRLVGSRFHQHSEKIESHDSPDTRRGRQLDQSPPYGRSTPTSTFHITDRPYYCLFSALWLHNIQSDKVVCALLDPIDKQNILVA